MMFFWAFGITVVPIEDGLTRHLFVFEKPVSETKEPNQSHLAPIAFKRTQYEASKNPYPPSLSPPTK